MLLDAGHYLYDSYMFSEPRLIDFLDERLLVV